MRDWSPNMLADMSMAPNPVSQMLADPLTMLA
jgi:hypothetical protein